MKLLVGLALFSALVAVSSAQKNIICYFASWTNYIPGNGKFTLADIDLNLCTHIFYGFVGLTYDNNVAILDDWELGPHEMRDFVALKTQNPNLTLSVSMGGWNEGSGKYSKMAADPNSRSTFVQNVVKFLDKYSLDGFDLDWEYPGQRDGANPSVDPDNFVSLLKELKAALQPKGKLLSIAVAGRVKSIDISYPDGKAVSDNVDIINVMAYDFHGAFEPFVGHYAPLYASSKDQTAEQKTLNVASGIQHWLDNGADPKKLHLGIGTYGRTFTLADPNKHELYDPTVGGGEAGPYTRQAGTIGYNEVCEFHKDWPETFDDEQKVPHKISGNQWFGYDNVQSITFKAQFAKDKGLGGVMVYTFDTDDFKNVCGGGKYPLIGAIKKVLG